MADKQQSSALFFFSIITQLVFAGQLLYAKKRQQESLEIAAELFPVYVHFILRRWILYVVLVQVLVRP
jgi:hypothetical protein